MANPFQRFIRGLGDIVNNVLGRKTPAPQRVEQEPSDLPPPQVVQPTPQNYPPVNPFATSGDTEEVGENLYYIARSGRALGRWQAGSPDRPVEIADIEDLLDTVPKSATYAVIVHGALESLYPGKVDKDDTFLSYSVERETLLDAIDDDNVEYASDFVNSFLIDTAPQWTDVYEISILDRF